MKKAIAILLVIVAAFVIAERQPQTVEISRVDNALVYVNYVDHNGDLYTDVYVEDAPIEVQVIAELR